MKELLFFLFGVAFAYIVEPIIEKLMCYILTAFDVGIGYLHIKLNQQRKIIEDIQEESIPKRSFQMGFTVPADNEECEDDDAESG